MSIQKDGFLFAEKYTHDIRMREKLYPLFEQVFGISPNLMTDFSDKGLWNDEYMPYSFFDGEQAIANVSAFPLPMMINGASIHCIGIQSVMTHPDYRRKGLMKALFQKMLDDADQTYEGSILYTSSPELYIPFGFKTVNQYSFKMDFAHTTIASSSSLRKLEPLTNPADLEILNKIAQHSKILSTTFFPIRYLNCLYFNFYNPAIYENLYLIEELDTILVFEVNNGILHLYDVMGEMIPPIEQLCSFIPYEFTSIEYYFHPEAFPSPNLRPIECEAQTKLMVRGNILVENELFMMPVTCEF